MSVTLAKLNKITELKTLPIPVGDEFLNIVYNRSKYTPKFERETKEMMDQQLQTGALANMIFTLLVDWDLEDDEQSPENLSLPEEKRKKVKVPLTAEIFDACLSIDALALIFEKMSEDNRPNPQ